MQKLLFPICVLLLAGPLAHAETAYPDFQIKRVNVEFIPTPAYQYCGAIRTTKPGMWMEMECDFQARPEFTDELMFTYYVYLNKHLFVGTVTHVNIAKSVDLHSVMYMSPKTVTRIMVNHPVNIGDIYVTVQITKPGIAQPLAEKSFKQAKSGWWAAMKQETGYILNKNETPFAPLYWDRYEAIKAPVQH